MGRQLSGKCLVSRQSFSALHKCRKLLLSNFFFLPFLLPCGKKKQKNQTHQALPLPFSHSEVPAVVQGTLPLLLLQRFMLAPSNPPAVAWDRVNELMEAAQYLSDYLHYASHFKFTLPFFCVWVFLLVWFFCLWFCFFFLLPPPYTSIINSAAWVDYIVTCFGLFHNLKGFG